MVHLHIAISIYHSGGKKMERISSPRFMVMSPALVKSAVGGASQMWPFPFAQALPC
jgi:hypothetical protein